MLMSTKQIDILVIGYGFRDWKFKKREAGSDHCSVCGCAFSAHIVEHYQQHFVTCRAKVRGRLTYDHFVQIQHTTILFESHEHTHTHTHTPRWARAETSGGCRLRRRYRW